MKFNVQALAHEQYERSSGSGRGRATHRARKGAAAWSGSGSPLPASSQAGPHPVPAGLAASRSGRAADLIRAGEAPEGGTEFRHCACAGRPRAPSGRGMRRIGSGGSGFPSTSSRPPAVRPTAQDLAPASGPLAVGRVPAVGSRRSATRGHEPVGGRVRRGPEICRALVSGPQARGRQPGDRFARRHRVGSVRNRGAG